MKDYKSLTSGFARIIQVNPNSASAHIMMDTAYIKCHSEPMRFTSIKPRRRQTQTLWAYIPAWANLYWRQGETELAEKEVRLELQHFPTDPVANFILGQILLNTSP